MPFAPGQSGNPGGRPKALAGLAEAARALTTVAVATLSGICRDEKAPAAARVAAAVALLDRGWGRPTQRNEFGADGQDRFAPVFLRVIRGP
jgi:hypothetical protein